MSKANLPNKGTNLTYDCKYCQNLALNLPHEKFNKMTCDSMIVNDILKMVLNSHTEKQWLKMEKKKRRELHSCSNAVGECHFPVPQRRLNL